MEHGYGIKQTTETPFSAITTDIFFPIQDRHIALRLTTIIDHTRLTKNETRIVWYVCTPAFSSDIVEVTASHFQDNTAVPL